ncbi:MAG TPA: YihY/virulence factor BrkB family protein [Nitrospiria bacterium]|nr:YihY/virulence factor BrkB family protein [Nitrospiria bacterium]
MIKKLPLGLEKIWVFLLKTVKRFFAVDGFFMASGLAFELLLSCIPFLFLVASGLGFFLFKNDVQMTWLQGVLEGLLPSTRQAFTDILLMIAVNRNQIGLIGFLFFFIFTSSMFGSVRTVLDRIIELKHERHFLIGKLWDLLVMLMASTLFVLALAMESLLVIIRRISERNYIFKSFIAQDWTATSFLLGLGFTISLFIILFRFCPSTRIGNKTLWICSITGTVLFEISKLVFAWYMTLSTNYTLLFGTLSGVLFFILWIYYSCLVFVLSAVVGWAIEHSSVRSV